MLEETSTGAELTARQREVLALVARGKTNAEVAEALRIAPGTVRKHLENVDAKLGVQTRTAAEDVVLFLAEQRPDVFALYEVEGKEVFDALTDLMPAYTFHITEGRQVQEILLGVRTNLTALGMQYRYVRDRDIVARQELRKLERGAKRRG